jgi:hypothetical protein
MRVLQEANFVDGVVKLLGEFLFPAGCVELREV